MNDTTQERSILTKEWMGNTTSMHFFFSFSLVFHSLPPMPLAISHLIRLTHSLTHSQSRLAGSRAVRPPSAPLSQLARDEPLRFVIVGFAEHEPVFTTD